MMSNSIECSAPIKTHLQLLRDSLNPQIDRRTPPSALDEVPTTFFWTIRKEREDRNGIRVSGVNAVMSSAVQQKVSGETLPLCRSYIMWVRSVA